MLIFKNKLPQSNRAAIIGKINQVATNLGIDSNWLMAVINFETAGTFSTSIQNPFTNATGLIQFMPATAIGLNTTVDQLKQMNFVEQMDFVEKYYRPYKSKIKSFVDLYLATFFPLAMGKPDNWVLQTNRISAKTIADQNPIFNDGGKVTVGSIKNGLLKKLPAEYLKYVVKQSAPYFLTGIILVTAIIFRKPIIKFMNDHLKLT